MGRAPAAALRHARRHFERCASRAFHEEQTRARSRPRASPTTTRTRATRVRRPHKEEVRREVEPLTGHVVAGDVRSYGAFAMGDDEKNVEHFARLLLQGPQELGCRGGRQVLRRRGRRQRTSVPDPQEVRPEVEPLLARRRWLAFATHETLCSFKVDNCCVCAEVLARPVRH